MDKNKEREIPSRKNDEPHYSWENEVQDVGHENSGDDNSLFSIPKPTGGLTRGESFCQNMTESFERLRQKMSPSSGHSLERVGLSGEYQEPKKIINAPSSKSLSACKSAVHKVCPANEFKQTIRKKQTSLTTLRLSDFSPAPSPRMPKTVRKVSKLRETKSSVVSSEIRSCASTNITGIRSNPNSGRRVKAGASCENRPSTASAPVTPRQNLKTKTRSSSICNSIKPKGQTTVSISEDELNELTKSESSNSAVGMKYRSNLSLGHHTPASTSTSQTLKDLIDSLCRIKSKLPKYAAVKASEATSSSSKEIGETLKESLEDFINQSNLDILRDCDEKLIGSQHLDEVEDLLGLELTDTEIDNEIHSVEKITHEILDISLENILLDAALETLNPIIGISEHNVDVDSISNNIVQLFSPNIDNTDDRVKPVVSLENFVETRDPIIEPQDSVLKTPTCETNQNEIADFIEPEIDNDRPENSSDLPNAEAEAQAKHSNDLLEQIRSAVLETPLAGSDQELFLRRDVLSRMLKLPEQFNSKEVLTLMNVSPNALNSDSQQDLEFEETGLQFRGAPVTPIEACPSDVNQRVASTFKEVRAIRFIIEKELKDLKNNFDPSTETKDSCVDSDAGADDGNIATDSSKNGTGEPDLQFKTSRTEFIQQIENELKEVDSCARWISKNLIEDIKGDEETSEWNSSPREIRDESFRLMNLPAKPVQECPAAESMPVVKLKQGVSATLKDSSQKKPVDSVKTKATVKKVDKKYQNLSYEFKDETTNNLSSEFENVSTTKSKDTGTPISTSSSESRLPKTSESKIQLSDNAFDATEIEIQPSSSKWEPYVTLPSFGILHEAFAPANYGFHFGQLSTYGQSTDRRKIASKCDIWSGSCDGDNSASKEYQEELSKSTDEVEYQEESSKSLNEVGLVESEPELLDHESNLTENMEDSEEIQTSNPESICTSKTYVLPAGTFRPSFLEFDVDDRKSTTSKDSSSDEEDDSSKIISASASSSEDEPVVEDVTGVQYCQGVPIIPSTSEIGRDIRAWFDDTVGPTFPNIQPLEKEPLPVVPESNILESGDGNRSMTEENHFTSDIIAVDSTETDGLDLDYKNSDRWTKISIGSRKLWEERNNHVQTNSIYVPVADESSSSEVSSMITAVLSSDQLSCENEVPDPNPGLELKERCRGDLEPETSLSQEPTTEENLPRTGSTTDTTTGPTSTQTDESKTYPSLVKTPTLSRLSRVRQWIGRIINPCIGLFRKNK